MGKPDQVVRVSALHLSLIHILNKQREAIYARRAAILEGTDLRDQAVELIGTLVEGLIRAYADEKLSQGEWDLAGLSKEIASILHVRSKPCLLYTSRCV